jgi:hypothetical protein
VSVTFSRTIRDWLKRICPSRSSTLLKSSRAAPTDGDPTRLDAWGYEQMAEITIQRSASHIHKLFEILSAYLQASDPLEKFASSVQMTPFEAGVYESTGTRRFEKTT